MVLQFIHDSKGNTTGVFIPIEDWLVLKSKYAELNQEELKSLKDLESWQKELLDDRVSDYYQNPYDVTDFNDTLKKVEKGL
jgi:hypothetical protein